MRPSDDYLDRITNLYCNERLSLKQIADLLEKPISSIRSDLIRIKIQLRTPAEGTRLRSAHFAQLRRGRPGHLQSEKTREKISATKLARSNAKGIRLTKSGYLEYTTGPYKGRLVHVVIMEDIIGRRLCWGEVVHHIDGNKENNNTNNLAFMTSGAHARWHRGSWTHTTENQERYKRQLQEQAVCVLVNGVPYPSLSSAARALNRDRSLISQWISKGKNGASKITREEYLHLTSEGVVK